MFPILRSITDSRTVNAWVLVAFALLSILVYHPAWTAEFILDAHYVILQNPSIKYWGRWPELWTGNLFAAYKTYSQDAASYYRPVLSMSYALDYIWNGVAPLGYRVVNTLLHAGNAFFLYCIFSRILRQRITAFWVAVLFCVHPVNEWVVAYVVGRGDLLQMVFSLAAIWHVLNYWDKGRQRSLLVAGLFYVLAFLSREAALLLPLYVLIIGWGMAIRRRMLWMPVLSLGSVAFVYVVVRQFFRPVLSQTWGDTLSGDNILQTASYVFEFLVRMMVPWSVQWRLPDIWRHPVVVSGAAAGLLMWILVRSGRKGLARLVVMSVGWIALGLGSLAASTGLIPALGPYLAEHFLYFTVPGAMLLVVMAARPEVSRAGRGVCFAILIYFLAVTSWRVQYWTSEKGLLRAIRITEPHDGTVADRQLLMKYEPDTERIVSLIEQAERPAIKSLWLRRLGQVYRASGDYTAAKAAFLSAVEWHPDNLDARNELAVCYLETGDTVRGMAELEASLDRDDDYAYTNRLIGIAFYHQNNFAKAISYLKKSADAYPEDPETWNYLAASYFLANDSAHYLRTLDRIEILHDSLRTAAFMAGELDKHGFTHQADQLRQVIFQSEPL